MLQYFAREFFAPVIITAELEPENKQLQIYAVCDTVSPNLENMELIINYYNYESLVPVSNLSVPITKLVIIVELELLFQFKIVQHFFRRD